MMLGIDMTGDYKGVVQTWLRDISRLVSKLEVSGKCDKCRRINTTDLCCVECCSQMQYCHKMLGIIVEY